MSSSLSSQLLPAPTMTDYAFLATQKNRSYFLLSRQKAARDHVARKWQLQSGETSSSTSGLGQSACQKALHVSLFFDPGFLDDGLYGNSGDARLSLLLKEFKTTHHSANLFDPERIEALHEVLEQTINEWTTFRPLLAEIKASISKYKTQLLKSDCITNTL